MRVDIVVIGLGGSLYM